MDAGPDCPATGAGAEKPLAAVVIHVLAEQSSLDRASEAPGYLSGFGAVPAPLLRELAGTAKLKPYRCRRRSPSRGIGPRPRWPSSSRCRDLTCRFPGCDAPAEVCEIDHTIPYPLGPTHPSNLKLLCVFHHLLKTFYTGRAAGPTDSCPTARGFGRAYSLKTRQWPL